MNTMALHVDLKHVEKTVKSMDTDDKLLQNDHCTNIERESAPLECFINDTILIGSASKNKNKFDYHFMFLINKNWSKIM